MSNEEQYSLRGAFDLVQRLKHRPRAHKSGFDAIFECDYMGSSEYEWGTIPRALRELRAVGPIVSTTVEVQGTTVYVVGPQENLDRHASKIVDWVDAGAHSRDGSGFTRALAGETQWVPDAWWALLIGITWTLNEAIAKDLVKALTPAA